MTRVAELLAALESLAPTRLAEPWDNNGLLIGDKNLSVDVCAFALDPTEQTVRAAHKLGARALVTHHPLFLKEVKSFTTDAAQGRTALTAAELGVSVICAHTNLDAADCGTAMTLARMMNLDDPKPLERGPGASEVKLVTFIPREALDEVARAVFDAGAGVIGEYTHCSFRLEGTGTFRPSDEADPYSGEIGKLNKEAETRMETVVPKAALGRVIEALVRAHPYEEPAYDVYPLRAPPDARGQGRIGALPEPTTLKALGRTIGKKLKTDHVLIASPKGSSRKKIRRLAVAPGSGSFAVGLVPTDGDCALLTGELNYHNGQEAIERGIPLILAGHFATEFPAVRRLAAAMTKVLEAAGHNIRCKTLTCESDSFEVITDV